MYCCCVAVQLRVLCVRRPHAGHGIGQVQVFFLFGGWRDSSLRLLIAILIQDFGASERFLRILCVPLSVHVLMRCQRQFDFWESAQYFTDESFLA